MDEIKSEFMLCSLCDEEYDSDSRLPRVLMCLHSCCSQCLRELSNKREIECPKCESKHDKTKEFEADFPVDSASRNFVDFLRFQRKPTEIPCTDCPDQEFAEIFCKDCFTFMCGVCASAHKRTQMTRKHVTTSLEDMRECGLDEFHRKDTCDKPGHQDQVYTFYCDRRGCDRPVCTLCAVCDHNQTNGHLIRNLSDVYDDSKAVVESVVRELNAKEGPVTESIDILQRLLDDLQEKENDIGDEIDQIFNNLVQILNERRNHLHKDLENHCQTKKRDLQCKLEHLRSYANSVQTATEFVQRAMTFTNATEFLLLKSIILRRLLELKNLTFTAPTKEDVTVRFHKAVNDDNFIELIRNIGNVSSRENPPTPTYEVATKIEEELVKIEEPEKLPRQVAPKTTSERHISYPNNQEKHIYQKQFSSSNQEKPTYQKQFSSSNQEKPTYQKQLSNPSNQEKPTYQRQISTPIDHGLKNVLESARIDVMNSPRQARQQMSLPMTNGMQMESPVRGPDEKQVVKCTDPDIARRLRTTPSSLFKSDKKLTSPIGLGDFLKDLEHRGELPRRLSIDKNLRAVGGGSDTTVQSPDRAFKPITPKAITPTTPTSPIKFGSPRSSQPLDVEGKDLTAPLQTTTQSCVTFGDVTCPEFLFDVETIHMEREVTIDGKILRNRKSGSPSGIGHSKRQLQKYKGVIGTFGFKDAGKYYYEIDVSFTIHQPLEETWLVFELGLCRADDIDKHHTVERHENARSCYVARYPEDGKLAQEFWHNRDLLTYTPLSENTIGLTVDVTYGLLVDTKRRKWTVADVKKQKKLHTFTGMDFSDAMLPVFGTYNPDLVSVEMTIRTGKEISTFPAFLKGF